MANHTPKDVFWMKLVKREVGEYPNVNVEFFPKQCMHCGNPPCVDVCPTGASYKRDDGIVIVDGSKCMGCAYCIMACPYDARTKMHEIRGYDPNVKLTEEEKASYKSSCRARTPSATSVWISWPRASNRCASRNLPHVCPLLRRPGRSQQ